jgi:importin-7
MLYLSFKIFYVGNHLKVFPPLKDMNLIRPWLGYFKRILDFNLPQPSVMSELKSLDRRNMYWKLKGMVARITNHLMSGYGWEEYALLAVASGAFESWDESFEDWDTEFSEKLCKEFLQTILNSHMSLFFASKTHFISVKTLAFNVKLIEHCTRSTENMLKLKPFIDNNFYETIIKILMLSDDDIENFNDNPVEFINGHLALEDVLYHPRALGMDFVKNIFGDFKSESSQKPDYLVPFLTYVVGTLDAFKIANESGKQLDWKFKEALMLSLGLLQEYMQPHTEIIDGI